MPLLFSFRAGWRGAAIVALAAAAGACHSSSAPPKPASPDVWAVVDGREIHKEDVERAYRSVVSPPATPPTDDEVLAMKLNVLDDLIDSNILEARARAAKLDVSDAEVDSTLADRKRDLTEDAFQAQLKAQGMTLDDLKTAIRRELLVQKIIDRDITAKVDVTDQQLADYYNAHRSQFNLAEPQYHLAQIVVTAGRDPNVRNRMHDDAATPEEVKRKVDLLTERLKAGADFASLAMDYSEDPQTVANGGDLGFMPLSALSRISPQVKDVVTKMQPGSVSTLGMGNNYTIVLLAEVEPAGQRDLSMPKVRDSVRDMLKAKRTELVHAAYLTSARNDAKITNYLAQQVLKGQ